MSVDAKDQALLSVLGRNARMSISELARELGVSRTTVKHRLERLESTGVISGYGLRLGEGYRESTLQSYVNLVLDPKVSARVVVQLKNMAEVEAVFTVSGKFDMVLLVRTASAAKLDSLLDRIGEIDGVLGTESAIVLSIKFDRRISQMAD